MFQKNETAVLVLALMITAALLGGGFWWFSRSGLNIAGTNQGNNNSTLTQTNQNSTQPNQTTTPAGATFAQVENQQTVRTVAVDGLTPEAANYPDQREL